MKGKLTFTEMCVMEDFCEREERLYKNPYEMDISELNAYIRVLDDDYQAVKAAMSALKKRSRFQKIKALFRGSASRFQEDVSAIHQRKENYFAGKYYIESYKTHRDEMEKLRGKLQWEMLGIPKAKPAVADNKEFYIPVTDPDQQEEETKEVKEFGSTSETTGEAT